MSKVFTITEGLENMGAVKTGGQGSVYKGKRTGKIITAVKLLPTPIFNPSNEDKHYRDFTNEVEKLRRVNEKPNPNVVKILSHGVSETGCFPYIEMEFIDGPDLAELLKPPHHSVFTIKEIIKVADHLSNALAHCHQLGVKHGDLKSNNVKFNESTGNYVLLDFGLAILSDEERRTSMRHAGAIEFMAPEQNEGEVLFETDVYSFGIILYELLAGRVPFALDGNSETGRNRVMIAHMETPPPDPLSLRAAVLPLDWTEEQKVQEMQVPEWLLNLVTKCLQKKPQERFTNGVVLHNYISHHHIHMANATEMVKNEGQKWASVVAAKDRELVMLRERLVASENKQPAYTTSPNEYSRPNGVSRARFNAVLLLLLLVGALAAYSLFFNKSAVGGVQTETAVMEDSVLQADKEIVKNNSESNRTAKDQKRSVAKKQKRDSLPTSTEPGVVQPQVVSKKQTVRDDAEEEPDIQSTRPRERETDEPNDEATQATGLRYKVRNKAFFHDEPNTDTRRDAFIIHWNNAVLQPLEEQNGFVYVVFKNHLGQTSKGWLSKEDLIALK